MAAAAPTAEKATEMLQKLSLDSLAKGHDVPHTTKKPFGSVDAGKMATVPVLSNEGSMTPLLQDFMDPSICYLPNGYGSPAYYYGAYDGSVNTWEDYSRHANPEEMSATGIYGDIYHHGYGYAPYGAYAPTGTPVPAMGPDGQLYGPQHYQYPGPYYPTTAPVSPALTPTPGNQPSMSQAQVSASVSADKPAISVDVRKANSKIIPNGKSNNQNVTVPFRPKPQNLSVTSNGLYGSGTFPGFPSGYPDARYSYDGMHSPISWFDGSSLPDGQQRFLTTSSGSSLVSHVGNNITSRSQNLHPVPQSMGLHAPRPTSGVGSTVPRFVNRISPSSKVYDQCINVYNMRSGFSSNGYDFRRNSCGWLPSSKGNGVFSYSNEITDGLCELKRGPRSGCFRGQNLLGPNVKIAVKGQKLQPNEDLSSVPERNLFNKVDFCVKYPDAKFYVIKSFSEDDVHKSVKYNVWASTQNGNKKLDAAYQESREKSGGCPIFLFFSVNTSGQFVGVAEMVGPVDFNKTVEYWQQDRWNGCFPVKWHIVKDVPNSILKHITLQNNDDKPVTNSRDTQEVKHEQGLQMLKMFKEHLSETSLLDDFLFYEVRQKTMQERRAKEQQFPKQGSLKVWSGKPTGALAAEEKEKDDVKGKLKFEKPLEVVSALNKVASQGASGEGKLSENVVAIEVAEAPKIAKITTEKRVVSNGVSKAC